MFGHRAGRVTVCGRRYGGSQFRTDLKELCGDWEGIFCQQKEICLRKVCPLITIVLFAIFALSLSFISLCGAILRESFSLFHLWAIYFLKLWTFCHGWRRAWMWMMFGLSNPSVLLYGRFGLREIVWCFEMSRLVRGRWRKWRGTWWRILIVPI